MLVRVHCVACAFRFAFVLRVHKSKEFASHNSCVLLLLLSLRLVGGVRVFVHGIKDVVVKARSLIDSACVNVCLSRHVL